MTARGIRAVREHLAKLPPSSSLTLAERRAQYDRAERVFATPSDVSVEIAQTPDRAAEWLTPPGARADAVVLYFHGGGYAIGSPRSHRHLAAALARAAGTRALLLDYRLAPEHPFPAAVEDAVSGYRYLLSRGIRPGRIAIAGDSAGGGLVVAAMLAIREAGLPQPACGWCISPWVDMEGIGETISTKAEADPMVQREGLLEMASLYLNGADPRSPLAAPIYADLRGLSPLLIQVGAAETLLDDAIRLAKIAGAADVRVDLQIWPEMVHVWHLFHPELKAGRRAIEAGGAYVLSMMAG